jgi:PAS domain S-box-containing protein
LPPSSHDEPGPGAAGEGAVEPPGRVDAEAALRDTEARLAQVVKLLHAGVFEWDLVAQKGFWSDENYRLMGIEPGTVTPSPEAFLSCVHPDDRPQVQETMLRALQGQGPLETSHRVLHPDGSVRWINETGTVVRDAAGAPIKFSGITLDVTAQYEAERQRRDFEARQAQILDAMRAGVWEIDLETRAGHWSDETYRLLGLPRSVPASLDAFVHAIHPGDRERVLGTLQRAIASDVPLSDECRVVLADGSVRWVANIGAVHRRDDGVAVRLSGITIDVTDRRQAEADAQAARERAVRRSEAQNAVSQALGSAESIDEALPRVLRATGEWLEWNFGEVWLVDDAAECLRFVDAWSSDPPAFRAFEAASLGLRLRRGEGIPGRVWTTGEPLWADDVTTLGGFMRSAVAIDVGLHASFAVPVTRRGAVVGVLQFFSRERRQPDRELLNMFAALGSQLGQFLERLDAREALRDSERQMRDVIDTAIDAVVAIDEAGNVADWSPQAEVMFGWSIGEVIGRPLHELIIPERYREAHRRGLERYLRTGEGPVLNTRLELEALHRDGHVFPVELSISALRRWRQTGDDEPRFWSAARQGVAFSAFIRDISERRRTDAALREAKEAAEAAARARADFLAVMSHEIRTPLNGVVGMISLVLKTALAPEQREQLLTARRSADLLLAVTNDALDFSKIEAGRLPIDRAPFDCVQVVHDVIGTVQPQVRPGVELSVVFEGYQAGAVVGDPMRLRQILVNLVGNAVKFTREGHVRLRVHAESPRGEEPIAFRFTVEDSGIGIPADKHETIFEAFAQADSSTTRRFGGTGLGLPIAARLAALMDGTLRLVRSSPEGSVFELVLPLRPATLPSARADVPQATRLSAHILVVDDNEVNREVAAAMLRQLGCSVGLAENGQQALDAIAGTHYDLVLMDCQMPEMDGFEATREARRRGFTSEVLPIIAMTARALPEDRRLSLEAGMDDHLSKPILEDALLGMLLKWVHPGARVAAAPTAAAAPAATVTAAQPDGAFDVERVLRTRELMADLPGAWEEIVETFVTQGGQTLDGMAAACTSGHLEVVRRLAHSLKGSAGMIGAVRLSGWCAEVEADARQQRAAQLSDMVARLRTEFDEVARMLRAGSIS